MVEERHAIRSSDESRGKVVAALADGAESAQLARRPLIKATAGAALGPVSYTHLDVYKRQQLAGHDGPAAQEVSR